LTTPHLNNQPGRHPPENDVVKSAPFVTRANGRKMSATRCLWRHFSQPVRPRPGRQKYRTWLARCPSSPLPGRRFPVKRLSSVSEQDGE